MRLIRPADSAKALETLSRFYQEDLVPAEKKPWLPRLKDSRGAWMALESAEGTEAAYLLDASSQIATMGMGFSSAALTGAAHHLESWLNRPDTEAARQLRLAFEQLLARKCAWPSISTRLCNSGAEAIEIALGLCHARRRNPKAKRILAFEGSFHGRTLVALGCTWNKKKRAPFEWPEVKTAWCPYPELEPEADTSVRLERPCPPGWPELWDSSPARDFSLPDKWEVAQAELAQLEREAQALLAVRRELSRGDVFAILVEPMQCEGGDRFSSDRFHSALLISARAFGVPVVYDEVQTGFHLGREFFWHRQFALQDEAGRPLSADFVVCAKKAQLGMVLSPAPLPQVEEEEFSFAGLARGYAQAIALDQSRQRIKQLEQQALDRLQAFAKRFAGHVERPRGRGLSLAFDLADSATVDAFVQRRFRRALLFYSAGERSLRFRLNCAYGEAELDFLFEQLALIGDELWYGKTAAPLGEDMAKRPADFLYRWQGRLITDKLAGKEREPVLAWIKEFFRREFNLQLVLIDKDNLANFAPDIERLQRETYEPARRTPLELFDKAASHKPGHCLALSAENGLVGICFAAPLSLFPRERGLRRHHCFSDPKALYAMDTTVDKSLRGRGIGRYLRYALSALAAASGMEQICGRNRDQLAGPMLRINTSLGARELFHLAEDYMDELPSRDALLYRCPLSWPALPPKLAGAVNSPLARTDLQASWMEEQLPVLANKLCLSNFASESFLSQLADIFALLPAPLRHGHSASGQSECVDKIAKTLWQQDKKTNRMLTFEGHHFGRGSFLARSLSGEGEPFFPVDTLPAPTEDNSDEVLQRLGRQLKRQRYRAVWIEPIPQYRLIPTPKTFLIALKDICSEAGVQVVYNETASGAFAWSKEHYFAGSDPLLTPDMGMAFLGGQAAITFCRKRLWLSEPLMLISTWDGDEFSFACAHRAMKLLLCQKAAYEEAITDFGHKLRATLRPYSPQEFSLHRARGRFKAAALPWRLRQLFCQKDGYWLVNPSFGAIREFLS